jgi:hypothetical protein
LNNLAVPTSSYEAVASNVVLFATGRSAMLRG